MSTLTSRLAHAVIAAGEAKAAAIGVPVNIAVLDAAAHLKAFSRMDGAVLVTPAGWGVYVSTKHALESVAEAMQQEVAPFGIKVQTINPGTYLTGYNETMADTAFRWLDDAKHFTKRAELRATFDRLLATPEGHVDPQEMIDRMIDIVPADNGKFRNVVPKAVEDMLKRSQAEAWEQQI